MRKQTACLVFLVLLLVSSPLPVVNIQPVKAWNGTIYIHADGNIDPSTAPIQQNGDVYTLTDNIISDGDGILIEKSNIEIDGNGHTIQGSYGGSGVSLTSVNDVTIRNINVQDFYYGILIVSASQTTISGNNLTANNIGIVLLDSSDYNSMNGNNINGNDIGIWVDSSSNNDIYHNNFIDNTLQVSTYDSANIWDNNYPAGGNYWSNYKGADQFRGPNQDGIGSDGICDASYAIDAANIDNFPLTKPYGGQHDTGITDVSKSKSIVIQGYELNVSARVINYGMQAETFNVAVKADSTTIGTQTVALSGRDSATVTLVCGTVGLARGSYAISAFVGPVMGETDTADNTLVGERVTVAYSGDVTGDGIVDIFDIVTVATVFGNAYPAPSWNPNADINNDGIIDIFDIVAVAVHFSEIGP